MTSIKCVKWPPQRPLKDQGSYPCHVHAKYIIQGGAQVTQCDHQSRGMYVEFNAAARAILPGGWLKTLVVD
jgi:hypothetical protein